MVETKYLIIAAVVVLVIIAIAWYYYYYSHHHAMKKCKVDADCKNPNESCTDGHCHSKPKNYMY